MWSEEWSLRETKAQRNWLRHWCTYYRSLRYDFAQDNAEPSRPMKCWSRFSMMWWSTVSKADDRSKRMRAQILNTNIWNKLWREVWTRSNTNVIKLLKHTHNYKYHGRPMFTYTPNSSDAESTKWDHQHSLR